MDEENINEKCMELVWRKYITSLTCHDELLKPEDWKWNRLPYVNDFLSTVYYTNNSITVHPQISIGTVAVKCTRKLTSTSIVYWEVDIPNIFGTSTMVGIGTSNTKMNSPTSFIDLLGKDNESMGLSHRGYICRNGIKKKFCHQLKFSNIIGLLFHGPKRTLSYFINHNYMGIVFDNIDTTKTHYPMVSTTAQKTQFILQNQFGIETLKTPDTLKEITLKHVTKQYISHKAELKLPSTIHEQILIHVLSDDNQNDYFQR